MAQPDYYEALQVHPAAEPEVIQAAYRRLSLKYHPDVYHGPDAQQRMALLNAAYSILGDATKRRAYDAQRGFAPRQTAGHAHQPGPPPRPAQSGPALQVTPAQVDLGTTGFGRTRTTTIRVRNAGAGRLSGFVLSHVPWLKVTPAEFSANEFDISILFKPDRTGEFVSPKGIEVVFNGGRTAIPVRATVSPSEEEPRPRPGGATGQDHGTRPQRTGPGRRPGHTARGGISHRGVFEVSQPAKRKLHVPFSAWVVAGTVISSTIWWQIAPVLAAVPVALGVWLLWNRAVVRPRQGDKPPVTSRPGPGHSSLLRCPSCGASVLSTAAAKCSRCGGSVCPSCNACPCRSASAARR